jgi:hypothetical protein
MLRNDDSNTYFLVTAQNDPTGTWTSARPLTINNSTGVCNINGNAATATNANNVNTTVTNGSTSNVSYGITYVADPNTSESNTVRKTNDFRISLKNGTAGTGGVAELVLGNNKNTSTADNKEGCISLYSSNTSYHTLKVESTTSPVIHTFPAVAGTIPSFTTTPTSGQVVVTDGTAGGIKSSGYTIATSVPSGAKFTDENVTQTNTTTSADYRVLLSGNANDTTETTTVRKSTNLKFSPSSGGLYSFGFLWTDITGLTLDINTLTLSNGTLHSRRFIEKTDGGSANITNIPVTGHPFLLEVDLIRWATTTDYITRQRFTNAANGTYSYVRYCTSGTWGSWTTRKYTDTDTKVTSSANHYTPATVSGQDKSDSASGAAEAWGIDVVTGVTLNTDGKGHVTGISVTSGKIPENPVPSNNVTGSGTSGYLTKWNGTHTITNGPQLGSSTTTFLRNDGSWATPPGTYTHPTYTRTDTTSTASPAHGGTFTAIDSVTSTNGHVTAVNLKTITLPADNDYRVKQENTTTSAEYRLLFSNSANDTTENAAISRKGTNLRYNPGTKSLYAGYYGSDPSITARLTSLNFTSSGAGTGRTKVRFDLATTSLTTGAPPAESGKNSSGHVTTYSWDSNIDIMTQIYIPNGDHVGSSYGPQPLMIRGDDSGTWLDWRGIATFSQSSGSITSGQVVITDGTLGLVKASGYTIATSVPSDAVFTDTKNTAGSTDTSSKIFLIGATSQAANPQTYSDDQCYVTSGTLQANKVQASVTVCANTANSNSAGGIAL